MNKLKEILKLLLIVNKKDSEKVSYLKNKFSHSVRGFYYGLTRRFADSLYCHATPGALETTIRIIEDSKKEGKLLNLGGGTGQVANIFKDLGFDVYNLDIDIKKEDENEKNINFDLNEIKNLPFPEKSFDVVVCQEIIEHVENPWKLFRDVKSIITTDGVFILSTPNPASLFSKIRFLFTGFFNWFTPDCFDYHINPLFNWELELISKKTGFKLISVSGSGDYFF